MSSIQSETARYAPKEETVTPNQKRSQSIKMDPGMTEMMELGTKMLKCYYNYKYLKKNIIIMSREMEDIKKNQVEHLEMKNILSKMKSV